MTSNLTTEKLIEKIIRESKEGKNDVFEQLKKDLTPIDGLVESDDSTSDAKRDEAVKILLDKGVIDLKFENGGKSLMEKIVIWESELLINFVIKKFGVGVKVHGETLLLCAVYYNKKNLTKQLIYLGSVLEQNDDKNFTLCCALVEDGWEDIVELLIKSGYDINLPNSKGVFPIVHAALYGKTSMVKMLLESKADIDVISSKEEAKATALEFAIFKNYIDIVDLLLEKGADVNKGYPLMYALKAENKSSVLKLLKAGVDINRKDKNGELPLIVAVELRLIAIANKIIQFDVDINLKDGKGNFMLAAVIANIICGKYQKEYEKEEKYVIEQMKRIDVRSFTPQLPEYAMTRLKKTAGDSSCSEVYLDTIDKMIEYEKSLDKKYRSRYLNFLRSVVKYPGIDLNLQQKDGNSAIMIAAIAKDFEIVDILLNTGKIDIGVINNDGHDLLDLVSVFDTKNDYNILARAISLENKYEKGEIEGTCPGEAQPIEQDDYFDYEAEQNSNLNSVSDGGQPKPSAPENG